MNRVGITVSISYHIGQSDFDFDCEKLVVYPKGSKQMKFGKYWFSQVFRIF